MRPGNAIHRPASRTLFQSGASACLQLTDDPVSNHSHLGKSLTRRVYIGGLINSYRRHSSPTRRTCRALSPEGARPFPFSSRPHVDDLSHLKSPSAARLVLVDENVARESLSGTQEIFE